MKNVIIVLTIIMRMRGSRSVSKMFQKIFHYINNK